MFRYEQWSGKNLWKMLGKAPLGAMNARLDRRTLFATPTGGVISEGAECDARRYPSCDDVIVPLIKTLKVLKLTKTPKLTRS